MLKVSTTPAPDFRHKTTPDLVGIFESSLRALIDKVRTGKGVSARELHLIGKTLRLHLPAIARLVSHLLDGTTEEKVRCLRMLAGVGARAGRFDFFHLVRDPNRAVRLQLLRTLDRLPFDRQVWSLEKFLDDPAPDVRLRAFQMLTRGFVTVNPRAVIPYAKKLLWDSDVVIALEAIKVAKALWINSGDDPSIDALMDDVKNLIWSKCRDVSRAASECYGSYTGDADLEMAA